MDVLVSWSGTAYCSGQLCRGVAADCVRFVVGVMDEMHGYEALPPIKTLPPDTALHDPRMAVRAVRAIAGRYPNDIVRGDEVEPGDVMVVAVGHGPGHVVIVGPQRNTIWHCDRGVGVSWTGFEQFRRIMRVWRSRDRKSWLP